MREKIRGAPITQRPLATYPLAQIVTICVWRIGSALLVVFTPDKRLFMRGKNVKSLLFPRNGFHSIGIDLMGADVPARLFLDALISHQKKGSGKSAFLFVSFCEFHATLRILFISRKYSNKRPIFRPSILYALYTKKQVKSDSNVISSNFLGFNFRVAFVLHFFS